MRARILTPVRKTVLHIEDCDADHELLKGTIGGHYHILRQRRIDDKYDAARFDIIVSDLRLTTTYGIETVRAVRSAYPNKPLLILTGMAGAFMTGDLVMKLMDAGADNVASKDILSSSHLLKLIGDLVDR